MEVLLLFVLLWGPNSNKLPWKFSCVHWLRIFLWNFIITNELCVKYDFIKNELKVNYESIDNKIRVH
jgi:hypothetical protein